MVSLEDLRLSAENMNALGKTCTAEEFPILALAELARRKKV